MVSNRGGRLSFKGILKLTRELLVMGLVAAWFIRGML
ncbi:MAG: hypothetical protein H6Q00_759 [Holophagaceae bacterium]|nr:hypothetical protein [Holophagaceae bacterium]